MAAMFLIFAVLQLITRCTSIPTAGHRSTLESSSDSFVRPGLPPIKTPQNIVVETTPSHPDWPHHDDHFSAGVRKGIRAIQLCTGRGSKDENRQGQVIDIRIDRVPECEHYWKHPQAHWDARNLKCKRVRIDMIFERPAAEDWSVWSVKNDYADYLAPWANWQVPFQVVKSPEVVDWGKAAAKFGPDDLPRIDLEAAMSLVKIDIEEWLLQPEDVKRPAYIENEPFDGAQARAGKHRAVLGKGHSRLSEDDSQSIKLMPYFQWTQAILRREKEGMSFTFPFKHASAIVLSNADFAILHWSKTSVSLPKDMMENHVTGIGFQASSSSGEGLDYLNDDSWESSSSEGSP